MRERVGVWGGGRSGYHGGVGGFRGGRDSFAGGGGSGSPRPYMVQCSAPQAHAEYAVIVDVYTQFSAGFEILPSFQFWAVRGVCACVCARGGVRFSDSFWLSLLKFRSWLCWLAAKEVHAGSAVRSQICRLLWGLKPLGLDHVLNFLDQVHAHTQTNTHAGYGFRVPIRTG